MSHDNLRNPEDQAPKNRTNSASWDILSDAELQEVSNVRRRILSDHDLVLNRQMQNGEIRAETIINHPRIQELKGLVKTANITDLKSSIFSSIFNFPNLERLTFSCGEDIKSIPDDIGNLTKLKELVITRSHLEKIPSTITKLKRLEHLELNTGNTNVIPWEMFQLPKLKTLNLGVPNLKLSGTLNCISRLKKLHISATAFGALQDNIHKLQNLKQISINGNMVLVDGAESVGEVLWPQNIDSLQKLEVLQIQHSTCKEIPDGATKLAGLKTLEIEDTDLDSWPSFAGLEQLEDLRISHCTSIATIPEDIGNLKYLKVLHLNHNASLVTLPDGIGKLVNLSNLSLQHSPLQHLPGSVGNLVNLSNLQLQSTQITHLPSGARNWRSLKALNLAYTQISTLPNEKMHWESLESIDLSGTRISFLPDWITDLDTLESLSASNAMLSSLPKNMGNMHSLRMCNVGGNELSTVPWGLLNLPNLQQLCLARNQISSIPEPIYLPSLLKLEMDLGSRRLFPLNNAGISLDTLQLNTFELNRDSTVNIPAILNTLNLAENQKVLALISGKSDPNDTYAVKAKKSMIGKVVTDFISFAWHGSFHEVHYKGLKKMLLEITSLDSNNPADLDRLEYLVSLMQVNSKACPTPVKVQLMHYYYLCVATSDEITPEEVFRIAASDWVTHETSKFALDLDKVTGLISFPEASQKIDTIELVEYQEKVVEAVCRHWSWQATPQSDGSSFTLFDLPYTSCNSNTQYLETGRLPSVCPREYDYRKNGKPASLSNEEVIVHNISVLCRKFVEYKPDGTPIQNETGRFKADMVKIRDMMSRIEHKYFGWKRAREVAFENAIYAQSTVHKEPIPEGFELNFDTEIFEKFSKNELRQRFMDYERRYIQEQKITNPEDICEALKELGSDEERWQRVCHQFLEDFRAKLITPTQDHTQELTSTSDVHKSSSQEPKEASFNKTLGTLMDVSDKPNSISANPSKSPEPSKKNPETPEMSGLNSTGPSRSSERPTQTTTGEISRIETENEGSSSRVIENSPLANQLATTLRRGGDRSHGPATR